MEPAAMNQSMIVKPYLGKATTDLNEAKDALGAAWSADDRGDPYDWRRPARRSRVRCRTFRVERLADCVDAHQTEPPQPPVRAR
jgi:hypothetical protein